MVDHNFDEEDMLDQSTHTSKIGILSSGALSNNIIKIIQEEYMDLVKEDSFETFIGTFDQFFSPNDTMEHEQKKYDELESESTMQTSADHEHDISDKTERDIDIDLVVDKDHIHIKEEENDNDSELIFQSDEFDELNEPEIRSKLTLNKTPIGLIDESNISSDISEEFEGTINGHPLSFRERAHKILIELKRKLGFVKEPTEDMHEKTTELAIEQTNIEQYDPEQGSTEAHSETKIVKDKPNQIPKSNEKDESPLEVNKELDSVDSPMNISIPTKLSLIQRHKVLMKTLNNMNILFIVSCLDDENDIENTFVMVELAEKMNIMTIVITSLPRYFGKVDNVHSTNKILQKLRLIADMVILLPYYESLQLKLIPDLIKELMELITLPGLINVDIADLNIIVKGGNVAVITFGRGRQVNRVKDAFYEALDSELLNVELAGVQKALLNVTGGQDMTIGEVEGIAEQIKLRIKPGARLILGARVDPNMNNRLKIFLMLGVTPMQVMVNRYANE